MSTIEKINTINECLRDIFDYTQKNETIKEDFSEYLSTIGSQNISLNQAEKIFLPYIFERNIGDKSILEIYRDNNEIKDADLIDGLIHSEASIFEIKKILKNGFELYNLINEKKYTVSPLTKMTNFRGIYSGQYIVARIFETDGTYYIIEIENVLSHSQKADAYRYAVMKLVQEPRRLYFDNPEKEEEIKIAIGEMYEKFTKTFNTDIILTTNKYADEIIGAFNEGEEIDLSNKSCDIEQLKFFHIKELDNNYSNFLENSMGGFSSHNELYDVAIIFDSKLGLYTIPFYKTFCEIFKGQEIENAKDCINYFLENFSIPKLVLDKVSSDNPNFMDIINKYLETEYSYEELIKKYKSEWLERDIYSSATVLYSSKAFSEVFDFFAEPTKESNIEQKVGRNEPCPCGSGKKFKHCCGKA